MDEIELGGEERAYKCDYLDVELLNEITQAMLVSLATACVEKTYGDFFSSATSVVADVKKEMVECLQKICDTGLPPESGNSSPPASLLPQVRDILDNFVESKKSFLNRVSSKILNTDAKDERIEDLVEELERSGGWLFGQREILARGLLNILDSEHAYHCGLSFVSGEELAGHKQECLLRPVACLNDDCGEVISMARFDAHDAECPFKLLMCEQHCEALVKRSDMNMHCVSDCPMKPVNCPFYHIGCTTILPERLVDQHCSEHTNSHLLHMLHTFQKQEAAITSLTQRLLIAEKSLSVTHRTEAVDIRTHKLMLQEQGSKIKALEQEAGKFRKSLKSSDVSKEILELQRGVQNLQKQIETLKMGALVAGT